MKKEIKIEKDFIRYMSDAYPNIIIRNNIRSDQVNELRQAFFSGAFCQGVHMRSMLVNAREEERLVNFYDHFNKFFAHYDETRVNGGDYKIGETE